MSRAAAIRNWVARQTEPVTAREILAAVDPDYPLGHLLACLCNEAKRGVILRVGTGPYKARWTMAGATHTVKPPTPAPPKPPAKAPTKTILTKRTPRPRALASKAAIGCIDIIKQMESAQIAADLADFKANGGRIQILRNGDFGSHNIPGKFTAETERQARQQFLYKQELQEKLRRRILEEQDEEVSA